MGHISDLKNELVLHVYRDVWSAHIPANLSLKKSPGTNRTEAEWVPGLAWTQEKNLLPPLGIQP